MNNTKLDTKKSEAFAERMMGVLNSGSLALMISIGHQTGIFDSMRRMSPATSEQIAAEAGLNERYVREWLGAMVTGGIIEYDQEGPLYSLPAEHAAWLTREPHLTISPCSHNSFLYLVLWKTVSSNALKKVVGYHTRHLRDFTR